MVIVISEITGKNYEITVACGIIHDYDFNYVRPIFSLQKKAGLYV